ncbi:MAG: cell surface protein SprA, partial [Cytophagia bacterium]|nr:cell surface protein SprA [Cytophagia bacterium]
FFPRNEANGLYGALVANAQAGARKINSIFDVLENTAPFDSLAPARDYEVLFARRLQPNQYSFHPLLGYVSLNTTLNNDEVLAVAYEYSVNGEIYRVGEFSQEVPSEQTDPTVLFLKLLKGTAIRTDLPTWDLMMKNIYSLNAFQLSNQNFRLDIVYTDVLNGNKNFIPEGSLAGQQLITVLGLDQLNTQLEPQPDGIFDFVNNLTVDQARGRIIFPRVEPFGQDLNAAFDAAGNTPSEIKGKYVFRPLYDSTRAWAQQFPELNRFRLVGQYQSASGSEISLGATNVPQGSVRVTAGGRLLSEGQDYTVDYMMGKVRIINSSLLSSAEPIQVAFENNPIFQANQRNMMGARLDYRLNKRINLGGTYVRMAERPITQKVNQGEEPVSNNILGADISMQQDSRFITRVLNLLPLYRSDEVSNFQLNAEVAHLLPGNSAVLGSAGVSYIDDFESSESNYDIRSFNSWFHSSTPSRYPEHRLRDSLPYGYNRANLSWYNIDPLFFRNSPLTPSHIQNDVAMKSNHYMREVLVQEVFPNRQLANNQPVNLPTFDLAFYPSEKGPYNFDVAPSPFSAGIDSAGRLLNPASRWGGMQRRVEPNDFEAANIEFIEFWMMDPFIYQPNHSGGTLFFNLGNCSEDILKDGRRSFENGFPKADGTGQVDTSAWGLVPKLPPLINAFDNNPASRVTQDVGLDGFNDAQERNFFGSRYLDRIESRFGSASPAFLSANQDPASDNYHHFRGSDFDNNRKSFESPVQLRNGTTEVVKWYQFRVPVLAPDRRVGNITDFKSIRFARMYFSGFTDSIICRMATMQLVRTDWRRYLQSLAPPGEYTPVDQGDPTVFLLSTVNIEENGNKLPIPYVLPPGIERVRNVFTTNFQQLNEQSLQVRFCQLRDGDSRAAFKNTTFDIRAYKRLEMFMHAEGADLQDGDVSAFVRLGNDYNQNYYEYEQALVITAPGTGTPESIWPAGNNLSILFADLNDAKKERNKQNWPLNIPFRTQTATGQRITVLGNPNLSQVQTIMLGVRNPRKTSGSSDDGLEKCGEIWFNELRLTEFDNRSGTAATGNLNMKLADLGTLSATGLYKGIGFGGLESKVSERSREELVQYDASTNLDLGKFLGSKSNLRIPIYAAYGETFSTPEFNPLDGDVLLKNILDGYEKGAKRDSIVYAAETYSRRRAFNLTNLQLTRQGSGMPKPWDLANFNLTLAYSELFQRNPFTAFNSTETYRGSLGYQYSGRSNPIRPLSTVPWLKPKALTLIRDFNFNLLPTSLTLRVDVDRLYQHTQLRNNADGGKGIAPTVNKNFLMNRVYGFRHDLTQGLRLEYDATAAARIDEPFGLLDTEAKRDTVLNNLRNGGRPTRFTHTMSANYQVPINKLPLMDFMNIAYQYQANYEWIAAPLAAVNLGNTIQNSRTQRINTNITMNTLYNKWAFLRKVLANQPLKDPVPAAPGSKAKDPKAKGSKTEDPKAKDPKAKGAAGSKPVGKKPPQEPEEDYSLSLWRSGIKAIAMLKNVSANISLTEGTVIPGFNQEPNLLGNNTDINAPGFPFVFGDQRDLRPAIITKNWLSTDTNLTALYVTNRNLNAQLQATLEPFKEFRITVTANKNDVMRFQQNFRANRLGEITQFNGMESGDFSISIISLRGFLEKIPTNPGQADYLSSGNFRRFEENRLEIAERLARSNPNSSGRGAIDSLFPDGYSRKSIDVLIPSFLAAYTGQNPGKTSTSYFPVLPMPNWRLNYSGLTQIPWFKERFQNIMISHGYRSVYSVGNFSTNLVYQERNGAASRRDSINTKDFYPRYQIAQISIAEQLTPLIGLDATLKNNLTLRLEYKTSRNLTLTLVNNRLNENTTRELTIGGGYRWNNPRLPFLINGELRELKNDLNLRFDLNIRDNFMLMRDLDGVEPQPSGGGRTVSVKPSADYVLNDMINVRFFVDYQLSTPYISTSFPNSQTSGGVSIRFTLAN